MKHNDLQKLVQEAIISSGGLAISVVSSNRKGIPDIVGSLKGGRFISVEVKTKRDKPKPHQKKVLADSNIVGGLGLVVHEKHLSLFLAFLQDPTHVPEELIAPPLNPLVVQVQML